FVWNQDQNGLECAVECNGSWAKYDNIFVCYQKNFPHSPDGRASIYFNDIYMNKIGATSNDITKKANIIFDGNSYWISFKAIIDSNDVSYNDLLSMTKLENAIIENIDSIGTGNYLGERRLNSFSCKLDNLDEQITLRTANNYYLPTSSNCNVTTLPAIRSGFEWKKQYLQKGTYYFYNKIKIEKAQDNNDLKMNFRASQQNNQSSSETNLNEFNLPIGVYTGNEIYAEIQIQDNPWTTLDFVDTTKTANLPFSQNKNLKLQIYNGTGGAITNGKVSLFSYGSIGARVAFINNDAEPSGDLLIDGNKSKIIGNNFNITRSTNIELDAQIKSTEEYSQNFLVIVFEYNDSNNIRRRFVDVVNIETKGGTITLNSKFFVYVSNQLYTGEIFSGTTSPEISSVKIEVEENCEDEYNSNNISKTININPANNSEDFFISGSEFGAIIEGVYGYDDCLWVTIQPKQKSDEYYEPIIRQKVLAGHYGAFDPSLGCVNIRSGTGKKYGNLNWGETAELFVENKCLQPIRFKISTGLECITFDNTPCNPSNGYALEPGENKIIKIIGKNTDFIEGKFPNFTDRLGYFPVYLQAKFEDSRKIFVNTDEFIVNLRNDQQCFEISSNYFDLTEVNKANFKITNYCQDPIEEINYPDATMESLGYKLLMKNLPTLDTINFDVNLEIGGIEYGTRTVETQKSLSWGQTTVSKTELDLKKDSSNPGKYNNLVFDFDSKGLTDFIGEEWNTDFIQVRIMDVGTSKLEIGAKIIDNIKITFADDTDKTLTLSELSCNSKINPFECDVCVSGPNNNHCISGISNELVHSDGTVYYTTFYIKNNHIGSNKKVSKIEMSFEGNENTDNLSITLTPKINYVERTEEIDKDVQTETTISLLLGTFSIPAQKNAKYYIINLKKVINNSIVLFENPKVDIITNKIDVVVWIEGERLMAKYIGELTNEYKSSNKMGEIELILSNEDMPPTGTQMGIINIKDYVNNVKATGLDKNISGVR
ncbi:MAG: hypothetical protein PHP82_02135, partial [Candidatus ainarchaeum sp.]|nr:hypothetical protein [Candidatus ainarchaeum sp.]